MNVVHEAVEAAARTYEPDVWEYLDDREGRLRGNLERLRERSLSRARAALEAAAPIIAAQAWDEGFEQGTIWTLRGCDVAGRASQANPYRSEQ